MILAVNNIIKLYTDFDAEYKKYLTGLSIITEPNYVLHNFILEKYKYLSDKINTIDNKVSTVIDCFKFDNDFFDLMTRLDYFVNFVNKIDIHEVKSLSSTNMENILSETINIHNYYDKFIITRNVIYKNITGLMFDIIKTTDVEEIQELYITYNNSILLYKKYMYSKISKSKNKKIADYIEQSKYKLFDNNKGDPVFNILQRFNYTPFKQRLSVDELIKLSLNLSLKKTNTKTGGGDAYDIKSLQKVSDIFLTKKIGVLVLVCIVNNPIEFNFSNLLNQKEQKYTDGMSVDSEMINFYNLIKQLKPKYPAILNNYTVGDIKSDKWMVVRTIDGDCYDILCNNYCSDIFVNKNEVDKIMRGPSELINIYQKQQSELLISFLHDPINLDIKKHNNPSAGIKNNVFNTLLTYYENNITSTDLTLYNLNNIVLSKDINNIILNVLLSSFMTLDVDYIPLDTVSFIYILDKLVYSYSNEIRDGYIKEEFNEKIFEKFNGINLFNIVMKKLRLYITNVTDKFFNADDDIFYNILLQNKLLNTHYNN